MKKSSSVSQSDVGSIQAPGGPKVDLHFVESRKLRLSNWGAGQIQYESSGWQNISQMCQQEIFRIVPGHPVGNSACGSAILSCHVMKLLVATLSSELCRVCLLAVKGGVMG